MMPTLQELLDAVASTADTVTVQSGVLVEATDDFNTALDSLAAALAANDGVATAAQAVLDANSVLVTARANYQTALDDYANARQALIDRLLQIIGA